MRHTKGMSNTEAPYTLILLRHGQSDWNEKNLFTGWVDVPLTEQGRRRPCAAASCSPRPGCCPDVLHTSLLKRAIHTAQSGPRGGRPPWIPVKRGLAPQRAPLRRAAGQGQGPDPRGVRRGAVHALAPLATTPRRRCSPTTPSSPGRRPALRRPGRRLPRAPSASRTSSTGLLPYWDDGSCRTSCRQDRAGHRARQLAARAGQAPRRHQRRRHRRAEHPHRHPAGLRARRGPQAHQGRPAPTSTPSGRCRRSKPWPTRASADPYQYRQKRAAPRQVEPPSPRGSGVASAQSTRMRAAIRRSPGR